jgi:hypothetical protein
MPEYRIVRVTHNEGGPDEHDAEDCPRTGPWPCGPLLPSHRWETRIDRRDELFTFGLDYDGYLEEIDLYAPNAEEALARVKLVAESDYVDGYTRIVSMDPGGSGGLVQVWRF